MMDESSILSRFDEFVQSGLVLYDDKQEIIKHTDGELKFQFCLTSALVKKPTINSTGSQVEAENRDGSDINTTGFEIGEISSTHFLVINKFCYARPHLLLLTSDGHQRQYEPLNENDLGAAWSVLTSMSRDYVAFFNCGRDGGCSRSHKHMQLIPMPDNSFASFLDSKDGGKEPNVPFQWFYHRFDDSRSVTSASLAAVYTDLLEQATRVGEGRSEHAAIAAQPGAACPHNMILTKRWMVLLPRRRAAINKEAGVNAIGMLGYIAVATRKEIDNLVRLGLADSLRELGVPK